MSAVQRKYGGAVAVSPGHDPTVFTATGLYEQWLTRVKCNSPPANGR